MGEVVDAGIITTLDIPPKRIIEGAVNADLETVIILGYDKDGEEYFASSTGTTGTILLLMERFKLQLLSDE